MQKVRCIDSTVGDILSGWRYDISGLCPEMRTDYEGHLHDCSHCRSRQRLHRTIDMILIGTTTLSTAAFVVALLVLHRIGPLRDWVLVDVQTHELSFVINLQMIAVVGLLASFMAWVVVAVTTPAPTYLSQQARALQERLPEELRGRLLKHSA